MIQKRDILFMFDLQARGGGNTGKNFLHNALPCKIQSSNVVSVEDNGDLRTRRGIENLDV